jgi:Complex 1 protein (LYR family)
MTFNAKPHLQAGMRGIAVRQYATYAEPARMRRVARGKKVLSLDHFLQRQRALGLWRDIVRATNKIRHHDTKQEMRTFARDEFERSRNVQDLEHIRYLISTGKEQFKSMSRYVDQMHKFGQ